MISARTVSHHECYQSWSLEKHLSVVSRAMFDLGGAYISYLTDSFWPDRLRFFPHISLHHACHARKSSPNWNCAKCMVSYLRLLEAYFSVNSSIQRALYTKNTEVRLLQDASVHGGGMSCLGLASLFRRSGIKLLRVLLGEVLPFAKSLRRPVMETPESGEWKNVEWLDRKSVV